MRGISRRLQRVLDAANDGLRSKGIPRDDREARRYQVLGAICAIGLLVAVLGAFAYGVFSRG